MVDKNDPLLREVEDELRREQWEKLWNQYGTYFLAAAALIVAVVGGFKLWEARTIANAQAAGTHYEAALKLLDTGKTDEAKTALGAIVVDGPKGYAALSRLTLAAASLKAGKPEEALATFEDLAKDSSVDPILASFAAVQAAALRAGDADFTEMQNRLTPLMTDTGTWRYAARELLGRSALKAGKLEEARTLLSPLLTDPGVPGDVVERTKRLLGEVALAELAKAPPPADGDAKAGTPEPAAK